jgi:hypothetical protein
MALIGLVGITIATSLLVLGANWLLDTGIELADSLFLLTPLYAYWALQKTYEKGREDGIQSANEK